MHILIIQTVCLGFFSVSHLIVADLAKRIINTLIVMLSLEPGRVTMLKLKTTGFQVDSDTPSAFYYCIVAVSALATK